jgi:aspartate 1-decarboxylase
VTAANREYEGSMSIDRDLMEKVGLLPERILCSNMENAAGLKPMPFWRAVASGEVVLNGPPSALAPGDPLTIMSFTEATAAEAKF